MYAIRSYYDTLPSNPDCVLGHTPVAYVAQSRDLPGISSGSFSAAVIKQAIMDYGAISTNMYFDDDYMSYSNYTYYYNGSSGTNHGVAIVGVITSYSIHYTKLYDFLPEIPSLS